MRESKFRTWDGLRMTKSGIMFNSTTGHLLAIANQPLMQYTGLLDKNGKEIYEGDIVSFNTSYELDNDDCSGITEVKWIEKEAGFFPFTLNNRWRCDVENVEVIGNIYENPELLVEV